MNIAMKFEGLAQSWRLERKQHLLVLCVAGGLALYAVVGLFGPEATELDLLEADVAQLQARLSAAPAQPTVAGPAVSIAPALLDWPAHAQMAAVWSWLQQRLQAQGLQVMALRPQALSPQGLPEQTVQLQLQGRWHDWLVLSQAMAVHAPWWVVDQWQVAPMSAGDVRIELQARVGWLPPFLQDSKRAVWMGPQWDVADRAVERPVADAPLFGMPETAAAEAVQLIPLLPQAPRHWPVRALRLQGVWQEAGQWHALLGEGLAQTTVRAGQRVGQEGMKVRRVDMAGVELIAGSGEPVVRLAWQGDKR
jgi:hypothetical protein